MPARLLTVLATMALVTSCVGDVGPKTGGAPSNGEADAADASDVAVDQGDAGDLGDSGGDGGPAAQETLDVGDFDGATFTSWVDQTDPHVEIISGFQGGFHTQPVALLSGDYARDALVGTISFEYVDETTGGVITMPSSFQFDGTWWQVHGGGAFRFQPPPVRFDVDDPSEIAGDQATLTVSVDFSDPTLDDLEVSVTVTLVDEVDELSG